MLEQRFFIQENLLERILDPYIKTIFLLGGPDTGKTTLIECLISLLKDNFLLGIIDSDMGQSHIGLPTTVAWAEMKADFTSWQDLKVKDFRFLGTLSPAGNTFRVLEALDFIFKKASKICHKVIIDTTGYIQGKEAIEFKKNKIELIQPDLLIALQKGDELEPILNTVEASGSSIFKMAVPAKVRGKSNMERAKFRRNLFEEYFSKGREVFFNKDIFKRWDNPAEGFFRKIVSLRDANGEDLALGVIEKELDTSIDVFTPFERMEEVSTIVVGNYKWLRDYEF